MYITIEGPEATGKSTHARILANALSERGYDVFLTKEPGSPHDAICTSIRKLLLDPNNIIADRAALLLFLADRAQHMEKVAEALAKDKVVISDRSSLSTYVYHTARERDYVSGMDTDLCGMLDFAQQIRPEMCLIFNSDVEWSLAQMRSRGALDRIECFDESFHARTHTLFGVEQISTLTKMLHIAPKDIVYVPDTSGHTESEIAAFVLNRVVQHLECE
jgi:dTMP kinase